MSGFLQGFTGWGRAFLTGYVVPSSLAAAYLIWILEPRVGISPLSRLKEGGSTEVAVLALACVVVAAVFLELISQTLYFTLFGYYGPNQWKEWAKQRQLRKKRQLFERVNNGTDEVGSLAAELATRYPSDDAHVYPTLLANTIASSQYFGWDRFGMDFERIAGELKACVPESLRREMEGKTSAIDFFVTLLYLAFALGILTFLYAVDSNPVRVDGRLLTYGVMCWALAGVCYRWAVTAADARRDSVQAMIHLGRVELARALGLVIPASLIEEREMWSTVMEFIRLPFDETIAQNLERFRDGDVSME